MNSEIFSRSELILGDDCMNKMQNKKVILFGIGGVGSWCAESLIRTGIKNLTIVDSDKVAESNINRQLMATTKTVGRVKTEALKERLLEINPEANITALQKIYSKENYQEFNLEQYDYIIDAIDSLGCKVHLIKTATQLNAKFYSSMGAALKVDPTKIKVTNFWKVTTCPLARKIRRELRKNKQPQTKFMCVFSEEVLENKEQKKIPKQNENTHELNSEGDPKLANHDWNTKKAQINGSLSHITAIFGFSLAGLVIKDIFDSAE